MLIFFVFYPNKEPFLYSGVIMKYSSLRESIYMTEIVEEAKKEELLK